MNLRHDTATPTLSVIDPRALAIRSVGYCRHPDRLVIEPRITRQVFDEAGGLASRGTHDCGGRRRNRI